MFGDQIKQKIRKTRERISKKLHKMKHVKLINRHIERIRLIESYNQIDRLKNNLRYDNSKCLIRHGQKLYSQNEEDGIIREIFNRVGTTNKVFVEFGIGDGLENNTLALLLDGWKGLWMDGSSRSIKNIQDHFHSVLGSGQLKILEAFVTKENINELISSQISEEEIDLLSIDVDGNDVHIFNTISVVNPRVVVIEYNAKFFPPIRFAVDYDPANAWQGDDYMGASLKYLEENFDNKGYSLVGCDLVGVNAFFVRNDLLGDKFLSPYSAETHYEPARYHLTGTAYGHAASYRSVEKVLSACVKVNKNSL